MSTPNEKEFVKLPYKVAKSLFEDKLSDLNKKIEKFLTKWNKTSIEQFVKLTKEGKLPEAETDAIVIENLSDKVQELQSLLQSFEIPNR